MTTNATTMTGAAATALTVAVAVAAILSRLPITWPPAVAIHAVSVGIALALGILQLTRQQRDIWHRAAGYGWLIAMLVGAGSSLWIPSFLPLVGSLGPIHLLSISIFFSVPRAVHLARTGRIEAHRKAMQSIFATGLILPGLLALGPGRRLGAILFGW